MRYQCFSGDSGGRLGDSWSRQSWFSPIAIAVLILAAFLNSGSALAQGSSATLFFDGFDSGAADRWSLGDGWSIQPDGGGYALNGEGHHWAEANTEGWMDYELGARLKLVRGGIHVVFRMAEERVSDTELIFSRYFLGVRPFELYLRKQVGDNFIPLHDDGSFSLTTDTWHTVHVALAGPNIQVRIDDIPRVDLTDTTDPLLFGRIAFETLDDSHALVDDVIVTGPAVIENPEGYRWFKTGGPSGGLGYDVRIHPDNSDVMFVTDNPSGVNKSYDGGQTWVQRNEGISNRTGPSLDGIPIFSLTIDPNDPSIVWVGTQFGRGIFKSTDGGETWASKDNGVVENQEISFRGFCVRPGNSNVVFAAAEIETGILGTEFGKQKGKIYKTMDGGENWYSVWSGDSLARFVLSDPTNPDTMYASTGIFDREAYNDVGVGVLKCTDGGENWWPANNGIPATDGNRFVGFLEMHPTNPQILFAASGNNAKGFGGVYRTTNGAASWEKVLGNDIFTAVTVSPSSPTVVYAGTAASYWRSSDGGTSGSWQRFVNPDETVGPPGIRAGVPISAVVHPEDPMTIFVNNYQGGNFKSSDGAQSWVNASRGYTGAHLHDICVARNDPGIVYTIGRSGPFRSYSAGDTWTGISFPPAVAPEWYAVELNPDNPMDVLMSDEFGGTIFKSVDGGTSWQLVFKHPLVNDSSTSPGEVRHGFRDFAWSPSNPDVVYAGMCKGRRTIGGDFPPRASYGMYKSTSGGASWEEINGGLESAYLLNILCIAVHPENPDIAYIGTWKEGVYKTVDGGQNWSLASDGLGANEVRSLAVNPQEPDIVYAGLGEGAGIYKTVNGGGLWQDANQGIELECPSYLLPLGRVPIGVSLDPPPQMRITGEYYSVPWTSVWGIVIDPTNPRTVYAGDHSSGVYLTTDGGANWSPINEGLSNRAVTELAISSDGIFVYAATEGGGVYRLEKPIARTVRWSQMK